MISYKDQRIVTTESNMRGGEGAVELSDLFNQKIPHIRVLKVLTLAPGCSIGLHPHENEAEVYYALNGTCTVVDHGEEVALQPGDAHICNDGEEHALLNKSTETVQVLAIIPTLAE